MNNKRSNILLILTDQQRLSTMSAYDSTSPCVTPNLDRLVKESIKFENAYTACPLCSPTRATIMTGLYPHSHGVTANVENLGCCLYELHDNPELLSRKLQESGYRCGYTGKWHLGTNRRKVYNVPNNPSLPSDVGFEGQNFPGHGAGGYKYQEYKDYLAMNNIELKIHEKTDMLPVKYGTLDMPVEGTVPCFLAKHTINLMDKFTEEKSRPFFIWHNFWGPHSPYYIPQKYLDMYKDVEIPRWPNYEWPSKSIQGPHTTKIHPELDSLDWENWENAIKHYYAFMTLIDEQIGAILDYMDETGLSENTVVIFMADHGETLGSHGGLIDKGFHHFDETQRVPMLVRLPDKKDANTVSDKFVSTTDVYPTILEYAGVKFDTEKIQGSSLKPLIEGKKPRWRDTVVTEFNGLGNLVLTLRSIRYENMKYGYNLGTTDELYDLDKDPYELNNQIDNPEYGEILKYMRRRLIEWMNETDDPIVRQDVFSKF